MVKRRKKKLPIFLVFMPVLFGALFSGCGTSYKKSTYEDSELNTLPWVSMSVDGINTEKKRGDT